MVNYVTIGGVNWGLLKSTDQSVVPLDPTTAYALETYLSAKTTNGHFGGTLAAYNALENCAFADVAYFYPTLPTPGVAMASGFAGFILANGDTNPNAFGAKVASIANKVMPIVVGVGLVAGGAGIVSTLVQPSNTTSNTNTNSSNPPLPPAPGGNTNTSSNTGGNLFASLFGLVGKILNPILSKL